MVPTAMVETTYSEDTMSKAKDKGTAGENEIVDLLVAAGFARADPEDPSSEGVKRFEGDHESHDIQGVGDWVVEVKFRKAWHLFGWVRRIRKRAGEKLPHPKFGMVIYNGAELMDLKPWVIFGIHGDRRTRVGKEVGVLAIMPGELAAELIYSWETKYENTTVPT